MDKNYKTASQKLIDKLASLDLNKQRIEELMDDGIFAVEKPDAIYIFECEDDCRMTVYPPLAVLKENTEFISVALDIFISKGMAESIKDWAAGKAACPLVAMDLYEISLHGEFFLSETVFEDDDETEGHNPEDFFGYRIAQCYNGGPVEWIDKKIYRSTGLAFDWVMDNNRDQLDIIICHGALNETEIRADFAWFICPYWRENEFDNKGDYSFVGPKKRTFKAEERVWICDHARDMHRPAMVMKDTEVEKDTDRVVVFLLSETGDDDDDIENINVRAGSVYKMADAVCPRCGETLCHEHGDIDYNYYCPHCDENM